MEQIDLNRPCLEEKLHKHMPGEGLACPSYTPRQPVSWGLCILYILTTEIFLTYIYKNVFSPLFFQAKGKDFHSEHFTCVSCNESLTGELLLTKMLSFVNLLDLPRRQGFELGSLCHLLTWRSTIFMA